MADENSTLAGGTQTSTQTGDDFVIGFGNDDTSGSTNPTVTDSEISENETNPSQNQEDFASDESKEESQGSSDSEIPNDDFSDFDVFGSSDADFTETEQDVDENISAEQDNDVVATENPEPSEETLPVEGSESTDNIMQENSNFESQVSAPVEEKKFVPLDENLGQDLNVDFDMGEEPKTGEDSPKSENSVQTSDETMIENKEVEKNSENILDDSDLFSTEEKVEEKPDDLNISVESASLKSSESEVAIEETTESSVMENTAVEPESQIVDKSISEDNFVFTDSNNELEENQTVENETTNLDDNQRTEDFIAESENSNFFNENSIDMEGTNAVESENIQLEPENTDLIQEEKPKNSSDFNFTTDENQDSAISDSLMTEEISEPSMQEVVNDNATQIEEIVPEEETVKDEQLNIENSIEEPDINNQADNFQQEEITENIENSQINSQLDMEPEGNIAFTPVEDEEPEKMENLTANEVVAEPENYAFQPVETETSEVSLNVNPQESEQGILDNEVKSFNDTENPVVANAETEVKSDENENLDFSFDMPIADVSVNNVEPVNTSESAQPDNVVSINSEANVEPSVTVENSVPSVETPVNEQIAEIPANPVENQNVTEETHTIDSKPEDNNSEVQSTLSLDQIMDAELLSSNQILNQPMTNNSQSSAVPVKSKNKSLIMAGMAAGLVVVLGFVTVTAFPDLFTNRDLEPQVITNNGTETPEYPEVSGENDGEHGSPENLSGTTEFQLADPSIEYSDVEFPEPGIDSDDSEKYPDGDGNDNPSPYIEDELYVEPETPEIQLVSEAEAMNTISSFKNQAEVYYNFGQQELDKLTIKYALKIKYLCETYESKITGGEGLDIESFEKFKSDINLVISQINTHNGGSDAEIYTVQEKSDNSDFEGKDEIRQYLYNK